MTRKEMDRRNRNHAIRVMAQAGLSDHNIAEVMKMTVRSVRGARYRAGILRRKAASSAPVTV